MSQCMIDLVRINLPQDIIWKLNADTRIFRAPDSTGIMSTRIGQHTLTLGMHDGLI